MPVPAFLILIVLLISAFVLYFRSATGTNASVRLEDNHDLTEGSAEKSDRQELYCRVQLIQQQTDESGSCIFSVHIRGKITAPEGFCSILAQVYITDVTQEASHPQVVLDAAGGTGTENSTPFVYGTELGKLPHRITELADWLTIGQINVNRLSFPRKGTRLLQFDVVLSSKQGGLEFARSRCNLDFENQQFGYIDLEENTRCAERLSVALAFAVSSADKKLYKCEIEVIKNRARQQLISENSSEKEKRNLEKSLKRTVRFFRRGGGVDACKICREIVEITPLSFRYDILELCLKVAAAKMIVSAEELALLKNLAKWLEADTEKFRSLSEKIIPANMHEAEDEEMVLGLTCDMDKDKVHRLLNKQYQKWNARVTNSDARIQAQADYMLKFIARARRKYVG